MTQARGPTPGCRGCQSGAEPGGPDAFGDLPGCCRELGEQLAPELFRALGDTNRCCILHLLAHGDEPRSVSEIAESCPTDISVVSRHLSQLREAGVLESTRRGRHVLYRIRYRELARRLRSLADALETCCGAQDEEDS